MPNPPESPGPDALWAPWRLPYLESLGDDAAPTDDPRDPDDAHATFLARYWATPELDAQHHIIARTDRGIILLNAYPYSNGHLLVALGEARAGLLDYTPDQRAALWLLVERATQLMQTALEPQGINIGINQHAAAGAGVPGHLHVHLVPRWAGDTNFITTVARVRVIPSALDAMADRYHLAAEQLKS